MLIQCLMDPQSSHAVYSRIKIRFFYTGLKLVASAKYLYNSTDMLKKSNFNSYNYLYFIWIISVHYLRIKMCPKDADRMAKSADSDQTAPHVWYDLELQVGHLRTIKVFVFKCCTPIRFCRDRTEMIVMIFIQDSTGNEWHNGIKLFYYWKEILVVIWKFQKEKRILQGTQMNRM